jgi:hypothetical protein
MTQEHKDHVRALLLDRIDALVGELFPNAKRESSDWRVGGLDGEAGTSLSIGRTGDRRGLWIDHATGECGDVIDLIQQRQGFVRFPDALAWATTWLGVPQTNAAHHPTPSVRRTPDPPAQKILPIAPHVFHLPTDKSGAIVPEVSERVLKSRARALMSNAAALAWLHARGLTDATIQRFHLGLYDAGDHVDALSYPLLAVDGTPRGRYTYGRIPHVTRGPKVDGDKPSKEWTAGAASTYWATPAKGRSDLLVVEGARDAWRVWQEIQGTTFEYLAIISSTHGTNVPKEWKEVGFWAAWRTVYVGTDSDDAGDAYAEKIRASAGREVRRARTPPETKDWTDWLQAGGSVEAFAAILENAPVLDAPIVLRSANAEKRAPGEYAVDPVDVNGAWVHGYLYYPYRVLATTKEDGVMLERYETRVLRSDGQVFSIAYLPAPEGTPVEDRVMALGDGTVIRRRPARGNRTGSFSVAAIERFRTARKKGVSALTRTAAQLAGEIERHLRARCWLPNDHDYALLVFGVMASYLQRVFDAVPIYLITGPPGSGKTELVLALSKLGCNGKLITGQTSPATAARLCDAAAGFVAFDDLEAIGKRATKGGLDFSELVDQLKVSYKREGAIKEITVPDRNGMKIEQLDFFGVKAICNTSGVDDEALGTRMLTIRTRKVADAQVGMEKGSTETGPEVLEGLRDDLHIWALEQAALVHATYRQRYANHDNRSAEIAAPLRTIAEVVADGTLSARLEGALAAQISTREAITTDTDLLKAALTNLVLRGNFERVTLQQLQLEMEVVAGDLYWGVENKQEIPMWRRPKWIGRTLRSEWLVESSTADRPRMWPGGMQASIYRLATDFVSGVIEAIREEGAPLPAAIENPLAFCSACPCRDCDYRPRCTWREEKQKKLPDGQIIRAARKRGDWPAVSD